MDGSQSSLPPDVTRHKFTSADVQAMIAAGVIREGEHRIELIAGELVEMSPQGPLHWRHTQSLGKWLSDNRPARTSVASNGPLRLTDHDEPEPELFLYPKALDVNVVRGPDVLLVVEVSHSSLRIDRDVKAPLYAACGVREYWVVDVENRQTLVYRLGGNSYGEPSPVPFDQPLVAPGGRPLVIDDLVPKA